jgi:hypothetical protein
MKAYRAMEVELHSSTSQLDYDAGVSFAPGRFTPGYQMNGRYMAPRAGMDPKEKIKVTCHYREWNHGSSAKPVPSKLSQLMTYFITATFFPF